MMTAAGHNSKVLTDNEDFALKMHHLRKRMARKAELKQLQELMKEEASLIKADGITVGLIDFGIKALGAEDKNTPVNKLMNEGKMLSDLGLIPAWNADLMADRATRSEKVFAAAKVRGASGLDRSTDYPPGSQDDKDDLAGWKEGQRIMAEDFSSGMAKRNAASGSTSKEEPPASGNDPFGTTEDALEWAKASPTDPKH